MREANGGDLYIQEAKTGRIRLDEDRPDLVFWMLVYCYNSSEKSPLKLDFYNMSRSGDTEAELRAQVTLYAMADKYQIFGLKQLMIRCFEKVLDGKGGPFRPISPAGVGRVASDVFEMTRDTETVLQNVILFYVTDRLHRLMVSNRFIAEIDRIDSIDGVDSFWKALAAINARQGSRPRKCPTCGKEDVAELYSREHDMKWPHKLFQCGACRAGHGLDEWNEGNGQLFKELAPDTDVWEDGNGNTDGNPSKKRKRSSAARCAKK
ncbi:uncharacterized protein J3D65DRAFT_684754 [Phyllosticta citribraziliensis]|uniref:Uncharacterized protein n=1 Tax=Phyllosticta citribraziliensis TaxID=989973 RepID=A0ABR1LD97_9PEZI